MRQNAIHGGNNGSIDITLRAGNLRNLSPETYRARRICSAQHDRSMEAEVRAILDYAEMPLSQTFMIDGLVQQDMSSGDTPADWVAKLLPA